MEALLRVGSVQIDAGTALLAIDWLTRTVRAELLLLPLPAAHATTLSAPEVMMRAATDSAGTLDNRLITVTGFTMASDGGTSRNRKLYGCKLFRPEDERQDCHRDRPPRQHVRLLILAP